MTLRSTGFAVLTGLFTMLSTGCATISKLTTVSDERKIPADLNSRTWSRYDYRFEQQHKINQYEPNTTKRDLTVTSSRPWAQDLIYKHTIEQLQVLKEQAFNRAIEETNRAHDALEQRYNDHKALADRISINGMTDTQAMQHSTNIEAMHVNYAIEHRKINSGMSDRLIEACRWYSVAVMAKDAQYLADPKWRDLQTTPLDSVSFMRSVENSGRDQAQRGSIEKTKQDSRQNGWDLSKLFGPVNGQDPSDFEAARADSAAAAQSARADSLSAVADALALIKSDSLRTAYADSVKLVNEDRMANEAKFRDGFRARAAEAIVGGYALKPDDVARARELDVFKDGTEKEKLKEAVIDALLPVIRVYERANKDSAMTSEIADRYKNAQDIAQISGVGTNYAAVFRKGFLDKAVSIASGKGGFLTDKEYNRAVALGMLDGEEGKATKDAVAGAFAAYSKAHSLETRTAENYEAYGRAEVVLKKLGIALDQFRPAVPAHIPQQQPAVPPVKGP